MRQQFTQKYFVRTLLITLITVTTFLVSTSSSEEELESETDENLSPPAIPIFQLYLDAKYAWDKLQLRKDVYGPNQTEFFFSTAVQSNTNYSTVNNLGLLSVFYSMYKITNDSSYLELASDLFSQILKYQTSQVSISGSSYNVIASYDWENDILSDSSISPVGFYVPIALEDSEYIPYFEDLLSTSHDIFWSPNKLVYNSRSKDGAITGTNCHLTWGSSISKKITQLLWLSELTGNSTYKHWADETIDAVWSFSSNSNLLPRSVNPITSIVNDNSVSHYDMAGWLCALELAYLLNDRSNTAGTGTYTYFDLINKTAQGIASHMWVGGSSQRWGYKTIYTTTETSSSLAEMNAIYVDYAMIIAYEITKNEEFLSKAITDFENEFMGSDPIIPNGVLMSNSLIIHSPSTLKTQCQFTGSSNIMVARTANLIFQYTRNETFLEKAKYHYNILTTTHRFPKGYTNMLATDTLLPYPSYNGYPSRIFDHAPTLAILALPCSFISSENVKIDWGYGLTSAMPDGYGLPGAFTGISIDIAARKVTLKSVVSEGDGSIFIYFEENSTIQSVIKDGNIHYSSFTGNTLFCDDGIHSYTITFNESSSMPTTTVSQTFPLSSTNPISTSLSESSATTSDSTSNSDSISKSESNSSDNTSENPSNQTSPIPFGSILISLMIYLFYKTKQSKKGK
ncbi:MAG: hypothetical protein ACXACU_18355 [Candidatus Hodarchaeales archaeon]|jgi:hypothetical protein